MGHIHAEGVDFDQTQGCILAKLTPKVPKNVDLIPTQWTFKTKGDSRYKG